MDYLAIYDAASDPGSALRRRVAVALHRAACAALDEDEHGPGAGPRRRWARNLVDNFASPEAIAGSVIWHVLADESISADPEAAADEAVQAVVDSLVDRCAGG